MTCAHAIFGKKSEYVLPFINSEYFDVADFKI